jgi:predicted CopG family antitoxin
MMVTTIQLDEGVKKELDRLKNEKETYEQVILGLMKFSEESKRRNKELLIEECKVMAEENLKINKEWEKTDTSLDWKW